MSTRPSKLNKRRTQRRQNDDRRKEIRWEPDKTTRRATHGRRREDGWKPDKKN